MMRILNVYLHGNYVGKLTQAESGRLNLDPKMAMKIGGKYKPEEVFLRHWHRIVPDTATSQNILNKELVYMAKKIPEISLELQKQLSTKYFSSPMVKRIQEIIKHRAKHVLGYFD